MLLVNLIIIFASLSISASILLRYRNQLREEQEKKRVQALIEKISENNHEINQAIFQYEEILQSERYISKAKFPKWLAQWKYLKPILIEYHESNLVQENDSEIRHLLDILLTRDSKIKQKNEKYIQQELTNNKVFFDNIEDHPLTENQRKTIVIDETNCLVVAGAGSGKTSTIIGKAGYLLENKYVDPSELLLISFARKARDEMYERGLEKINQELNVYTFHSLGLSILGQVEGKIPSLSELSTDKLKLVNAIDSFIEKRSENKDFLVKLNAFFIFHNTPSVSEFEFETKGEYIDYLKNNEIRSLNGDLVKSFEELDIANFLYLNGIKYAYETDYEISTADRIHRQYKPDFFIPERGIYIEHFGIDENKHTAPFVDNKKYLESMEWKRNIHRLNKTKLIETYSWQKKRGILLKGLEDKLRKNDVNFNPLSPKEMFEKINKLGLIKPFSNLVATFLNLFKSSNKTIPELYEKARTYEKKERYTAYLDIFSEIFEEYQETLGDEIDFNDMINKASEYLREKQYVSPYKYVLVDEFQDISFSRYTLLKGLVENNPNVKSFCVGDDWQSIYRFTGSDISVMSRFDSHFYPSEIMTLDKTFRFNNMLCDVSTKFILENPMQIKKQLSTLKTELHPAVTLHWTINESKRIDDIVKIIPHNDEKTTIFILGRYNHLRPENLYRLRKQYPNCSINYHTIHSSKGKEADYVIVVGLRSGRYSFPSHIEDDPILNLVLSEEELTPNAEERRLFYVALTRAREHVHLLVDPTRPSSFASELEKNNYPIHSVGDRPLVGLNCPECKTGQIVSKWSERGQFFSCNNYPYCDTIMRTCPECGEGFIIKQGEYHVCSTGICSFNAQPCPKCDNGYLVERSGHTKFLGCSNYPKCRYTRTIGPRKRTYRRRH